MTYIGDYETHNVKNVMEPSMMIPYLLSAVMLVLACVDQETRCLLQRIYEVVMSRLLDTYIRYAKRFKNKAKPWWKRWWWAVAFGVVALLVIGLWYFKQKQEASLRTRAVLAERRAADSKVKARAAKNVEEAAEHRRWARQYENEAVQLRKKRSKIKSQYGKIKERIDATKDWRKLERLYNDLD